MAEAFRPDEYLGEELCPRCGVGFGTGRYYKICTDPEFTHEESCAQYTYCEDRLCDECEESVRYDDNRP